MGPCPCLAKGDISRRGLHMQHFWAPGTSCPPPMGPLGAVRPRRPLQTGTFLLDNYRVEREDGAGPTVLTCLILFF